MDQQNNATMGGGTWSRRLPFLIPLLLFVGIGIFLAVGLTLNPREVPSPLIGKPVPQFKLPPVQGRKLGLTMLLFGALALAQLGLAADALKVDEARVVATVPGQTVAAAYMALESPTDARVVAAESDAAASVQIHTMSMQGDVMRMRRLEALDLPARRVVRLAPGGTHLMLAGLRAPLRPGDTVALRLTVTDSRGASRSVTLRLPVVDGGHGSGGHHD